MARNSPLCKRCKVLEFDDKALGASVGILKTGERYAVFKPKFSSDLGYHYELSPKYNLKDTFPDLPVLAAEQCGMCALMRKQFLEVGKEEKLHSATLEILKMKFDFIGFHGYHLRHMNGLVVYFRLNEGKLRTMVFSIQAEPTDPCYNWLDLRPISSSVLSKSGISRIREMVGGTISRSDLDTEECYLPTRLIHVGGEQHEPQLVVSRMHLPFLLENDGCNARYIALSYSWGSRTEAEQQLKPTMDSFKSYMQRIPIEALPQTLLDALLVCRALGVQYLWVDALCIIQGDKSDWERESANMGNVYSHSFLTICAAQGDSCQSGFLKRHPPSQLEIPFHSSLDPSVSGRYSLRQDSRLHCSSFYNTCTPGLPFAVDIRYSSWNSRAWTFQEVKLSPRALLFGTYMTHLCAANIYEPEDGEGQLFSRVMGPSLTNNDYSHSMTRSEAYSDWYSLVELYTARSLTYHDDILVAISAVAKRFFTNLSGKYLAGLWEEDLHNGLLWVNTDCDGEKSDMKTAYTAPSWSWACQPCPVTFYKSQSTRGVIEKATVLTAETSFTIDPYGQVTDGFVSLSAKAYKISSTRHWTIHVDHKPLFRHGSNGDLSSDVTLWLPLTSGEGGYKVHVRFDRNYILEEHLISQISIVLICSDGWDKMLGLLVLPSATRDEYRRAGLFMSEGLIFGGAKFWDNVETTTIKLV